MASDVKRLRLSFSIFRVRPGDVRRDTRSGREDRSAKQPQWAMVFFTLGDQSGGLDRFLFEVLTPEMQEQCRASLSRIPKVMPEVSS